ncbi:MAG: hypothetical protein EPN98_21470 [Phenylobacterium sp.]|uniref:hypothetical protein n=1 Tax=Phenylobacterium sp. TaxID=1871053 RepID=UPI00121B33F6|nr:hypothetical protein [Phenylobacterium sp.]TAL29015.1 MAG: hypothetical protein EPN98_21470 [Phenylobacterium sp.]
MGLLDVFAAVQAQLKSNLADLSLLGVMPKFEMGEVALAKEGDYPRIVWVPRSESITPADAQGGDGVSNPRPLWKRQCSVMAGIWGKDIADCESIAKHLVAAAHDVGWGWDGVQSATWNTAAVLQRGVEYRLMLTFAIPFTREKDVLSLPIEDFPLTETILPLVATG